MNQTIKNTIYSQKQDQTNNSNKKSSTDTLARSLFHNHNYKQVIDLMKKIGNNNQKKQPDQYEGNKFQPQNRQIQNKHILQDSMNEKTINNGLTPISPLNDQQ